VRPGAVAAPIRTGRRAALPAALLSAVGALALEPAGAQALPREAPAHAASGPVATASGLDAAIAFADSLIRREVGVRFAGAVFVVSHHGRVVAERAYGVRQRLDDDGRVLRSPPAMQPTTRFDLASLTKVLATTTAVMQLVDAGRLALDAPVHNLLPAFRGPALDSITVRQLLTHTAGLVQWQPLYYAAATPAEALEAIRTMPLPWGVGAGRHYSDLGFMLLGQIVEAVHGRPLDVVVDSLLARPLGLRATGFRRAAGGAVGSGRDAGRNADSDAGPVAATELGNGYERRMVVDSTFGYRYRGDPTAWRGWRSRVLVGEVNDGNAWHAFGGVAGHAGLFASARDVARLVDLVVQGGAVDGQRLVGEATVRRFLVRDAHGHPLGWMAPAGMPEGSITHTGFTGTWVLGVPSLGLSVVLLTNRQQMGTDARGLFPDLGPLQRDLARVLVAGAAAAAPASREAAVPTATPASAPAGAAAPPAPPTPPGARRR
jgi:CubicO group peptidase (beta-lactamase class C family)